jgi:hypothetical protein
MASSDRDPEDILTDISHMAYGPRLSPGIQFETVHTIASDHADKPILSLCLRSEKWLARCRAAKGAKGLNGDDSRGAQTIWEMALKVLVWAVDTRQAQLGGIVWTKCPENARRRLVKV